MSDAVVVATVTAIATVLAQVVIAHSNREKDGVQRARRDQNLDDRLKTIEKKLDEHNGYAQRFGQIEKDLAKISKDIEYLKKGAK